MEDILHHTWILSKIPTLFGADNPMFNPVIQYEQAYMYYRYLTQNIEYKIKCKEYEKLCSKDNSRQDKRIE